MKSFWSIFLLLFCVTNAFSQQNIQSVEKKGIVYKKDLSFGFRLFTQGWGFFTDIGRQQTVNKKKFYQIEITEIRHPKQDKQSSDITSSAFSSAKPYFYGKQNTFVTLHFGYGYRKIIGEKAEKSGVEVSWSYMLGGSLGLLKPYYIYVFQNDNSSNGLGLNAIKYSEENAAEFLDRSVIYGSAGLFYGAGETKIMPGFHGKLIFHFDWAKDDDALKEIQVGVSLDAYLSKTPIMVIEENQQFYPQFFGGIAFGKRR